MSVIGSNVLAGASGSAGAAGYEIERSLRFNSADSAYLDRTPSSAGNRRTWTWSGWVKLTKPSSTLRLLSAGTAATQISEIYYTSDQLRIFHYPGSISIEVITAQVFRDFSAWHHVVVAVDTTQSTASNRVRLYVNGSEVDSFSTATYPSQNTDTFVNGANAHYISATTGDNNAPQSLYYGDGYLADVHFIDGQTPGTATDDANGSVTGTPNAEYLTDFGEYDDNGVWQPKRYSGTYGTNGFYLDFSDNSSDAALGDDSSGNNNDWTVNNLAATAPGLSTANQGMDVVTYTGTGNQMSISSLQFQPDLVWIKRRDGAASHSLHDSVRGVGSELSSNSTSAEDTQGKFVSFDSNGWTMNGSYGTVNISGQTFVAWCWKAGGTAVSNTDGTLTSSVSANTTYGFSIVKWDTTSSAETVGHGLNAAPEFILMKTINTTGPWLIYHIDVGASKYFDFTASAASTNSLVYTTAPTSSVFSPGDGIVNTSIYDEMIAYCWSEVSGFSKFGSYTGSGAVGNKETLGFKPRWVLIKCSTTAAQEWVIFDTKRNPSNPADDYLYANSNAAEASFSNRRIEVLADGFQFYGADPAVNNSGDTYIYAAFAEQPDGSIIDSLIDTPTNADTPTDTGVGGEVVGNYCTWNPLDTNSATLTNGNLDITTPTSGHGKTRGTIAVSSGKWYWEHTISSGATSIGILDASEAIDTSLLGETSGAYVYYSEGASYTKKINGNTRTDYGASFGAGDVIGVALDLDGGTLTFYKNGSSQGQAFSSISGTYAPAISDGSNAASASGSTNFGQRAFAYTAPSGFKALCTANLTDPTIADGSTAFDAKLWTGNATDNRDITGYGFSPDLVWIKERGSTGDHHLFDIVRGANKALRSNEPDAEVTTSDELKAFNSDGFRLGTGGDVNASGTATVGWAWDAGSSTVSNTDGSIASSVRANASAGFSIVSYSGSGSSGTVGHGLNAAPELILLKERNGAENWRVHHVGVNDFSKTLFLNLTNAATTNTERISATSSSTFTLSSGGAGINSSSKTYVAYCFAPVESYSSMGVYTGNGSADGPFVYTGFRPRLIMTKSTSNVNDWYMYDTSRNTYNESTKILSANQSTAENDFDNAGIDILSNGFKLKADPGGYSNFNGWNYVYIAFAENPFKTARAR